MKLLVTVIKNIIVDITLNIFDVNTVNATVNKSEKLYGKYWKHLLTIPIT